VDVKEGGVGERAGGNGKGERERKELRIPGSGLEELHFGK